MYFKVRRWDAKSNDDYIFVSMSKKSFISELRKVIEENAGVDPKRQMLFFRGKQLVDDHKIIDYDIQLNDIVQLMVKPEVSEAPESTPKVEIQETIEDKFTKTESRYYKIGDPVDCFSHLGAGWLEGEIVEILTDTESYVNESDHLLFVCKLDKYQDSDPIRYKFNEIRPRSFYTYNKEELQEGMTVLANYNIEEPNTRGHWFDVKITDMKYTKIEGVAYVSEHLPNLEVKIKFTNETMRIETPCLMAERPRTGLPRPEPRLYAFDCSKCKDDPTKNCKHCCCKVCAIKKDAAQLLLCDECDRGYHLYCLDPPLTEIPDEDWYCPACRVDRGEIVNAGEKLKASAKKSRMQSNRNGHEGRDWGKGMACVGRTKECTLVPKNHFGPVPGVEVGTMWKYRVQVSESGVHRPHVAGIHGKEAEGAYSLVLAGGYEDDIDNGEEFFYTGSGGRDLSGNKRVNVQSCDQKLTHYNKALALNCNAKFNDKDGAEATDWKSGKPVRVVRSYKLAKHSKFAPSEGIRYDGIYKVVKYFPEKGQSGFIVWRYLLRRDDPMPAPWEKGAPVFEMIYPPGYLEYQANLTKPTKKTIEPKKTKDESKKTKAEPKNGSKRKTLDDFFSGSPKAKQKKTETVVSEKCEALIRKDKLNEKLWQECLELAREGKKPFLDKVGETFLCICCQELLFEPVTTDCKHNMCKSCLLRSFKAEVFSCPYCRHDLDKDRVGVNQELFSVLKLIFPGYENSR